MAKGLEHFIAKYPYEAVIIFMVMIITTTLSLLFALFIWRASRITKARLRAALIHQMECTQQAERRSLNKSAAFANASHDIRGALGAIITLIELSYDFVLSGSEVEGNLRQMHTSATDLMGLLNSLLDTSKIEAGRLELEDSEFNLMQLLEEVADFYHPTAMKKGVEVILDICDDSATKFSNVRGDRLRLKQIISNLVSNAVKFTLKGSICIRVWVRKPCNDLVESTSCMLVSTQEGGCFDWILCKLFKGEESLDDIRTPQQNPNCMEYVIEVDDTGLGIPKDKQKSVFENFVQVKESSLGNGGTGLGLGIVQSLVRLMGGDISIVDKEPGKEGTRFKFNIFLTACDLHRTNLDIEAPPLMASIYDAPHLQNINGSSSSSLVVLLIHNNERRKVVKRYFERLGIKVSVVRHSEYFQGHLRRIRNMLVTQSQNSTTEWTSSQSDYLSIGRSTKVKYGKKEVPLSSLDGIDDQVMKTNKGTTPSFFLFLIDVNGELYDEMNDLVEKFIQEFCNNVKSKVVWLEGSKGVSMERMKLATNDDAMIMSKPLHGSRLHQIAKLLPEYGGVSSSLEHHHHQHDIKNISNIRPSYNTSEIQEEYSSLPLTGLRILVAEDTPLLATLACRILSMIGASDIHVAQNGKEALDMVLQGLSKPTSSSETVLPFDLIFMDCEMPVMSGFEATREIRKAEKAYDVHIPIIALTAHTSPERIKETEAVGMDDYMSKPINKETLVQTITRTLT